MSQNDAQSLDMLQGVIEGTRSITAALNAVVNQMTEGLVVFDPQGNLLRMNPAAQAIHGFDDDAELRRHLDDLDNIFVLYDLEGHRLPVERWPIGRVLAGETFDSYEVRVRRQDVSRSWIGSYGGTMVRDEDGEPILAIVTLRDITEHHAAQRALRRSEQRFRQLADAMPQLVWAAEPNGVITYANERRSEYGGTRRLPNGTYQWKGMLHPDDAEASLRAWNEALANGETYEYEHRMMMADGSYRWHLSRGVPFHDERGEVVRWFGTSTDIEERKRAEIALRQADQRKDEFLAILGHELRNPLAAIANGLSVAGREGLRSKQRHEALEMAQRHATKMTRLLDDLLDISRITRGKLEVDLSPQPLGPIIDGAVDAVRPRMRDFGHHLERGPLADVYVNADATRLEQVISNLLDNAASYTPPGGRIELSVDADAETVAIHVRDNGRGIDPAELESIFEPFHQGEGGPGRGLGIGLALAHQLVELHHGRIHAHSEGRGRGSEFVVELPRVDRPAHPDAPGDAEPSAELAGLPVLIVDDNVDAAELLAVLLRNSGCKVTTAATGYDGLEAARRQNFDVVLLDIGLPDLDGRQVARRLREEPGYEDSCLIAVSGYTQQQDIEESEKAGFDAHLGKPVSQDQLRRIMAAHCELPIEVPETSTGSTPEDLAATETAGDAAPTHDAKPGELPEVLELFRQLDHDLRTPLSSVEMSGWAIGATQDAGAPAETAARLLRASESMTELIDRANDLAALMTRGQRALQREPADLGEVVESALEQQPSADDPPLSISVSRHGPLQGEWDVARLRSVLSRIISRSCADSSLGLSIALIGEDNTATIELDLREELPGLDKAFDEIDNLDSLHMDLNYAHWLVQAHAGSTSIDRHDGHTVVRFELPRPR